MSDRILVMSAGHVAVERGTLACSCISTSHGVGRYVPLTIRLEGPMFSPGANFKMPALGQLEEKVLKQHDPFGTGTIYFSVVTLTTGRHKQRYTETKHTIIHRTRGR